MLDQQLTFDSHASYLKRRVSVKMKVLCRVKQYISQSLALQLYCTFILPDFDYADVIYDSFSQQNAQKLQVMQNQCLKACTNSNRRTSTADLHQRVNMPLLSTRRKVHTCNFVYKGINNQRSKGVNNMYKQQARRNTNNTRAIENRDLVIPFSKLETCKGNVRIRGAEYYNSINPSTKSAPSYNAFKSRIKKECFDKSNN